MRILYLLHICIFEMIDILLTAAHLEHTDMGVEWILGEIHLAGNLDCNPEIGILRICQTLV